MPDTKDSLDRSVRWLVYDATMRDGVPPTSSAVAKALGISPANVIVSFERLAAAHILVLQPENREILMANPFSAVPTPFRVEIGKMSSYGNCIWDALGIPAMLGKDARIVTSCGDCGAAAIVQVKKDKVHGQGLLHFAIPARLWWNNIVFT